MSRLRSARAARGATRPAAAPQRGIYVQQPKSDVYVVMLGIALGAILIGCLLLVLVWGRYDYSTTVSALSPMAADPPVTALAKLPGKNLTILG